MHILDTLEQCHLSKIRHYCDHSMNFMAVPLENPMVASILPLILSCAPGDEPAIDALRLSLLGVASSQQSFVLSRSQVCSNSAKEYMLPASTSRLKSKQTLARVCATPMVLRVMPPLEHR